MKKTVKGLMVISAVATSFLTAQVASADTEIIGGLVDQISLCTTDDCTFINVQLCTAEPKGNTVSGKEFITCTDDVVSVYGLGPADYWANYVVAEDIIGVEYPVVGDYVTVEAEYRPCEDRYVAFSMEVCDVVNQEPVNCVFILLRDEDGDVLWNQ